MYSNFSFNIQFILKRGVDRTTRKKSSYKIGVNIEKSGTELVKTALNKS